MSARLLLIPALATFGCILPVTTALSQTTFTRSETAPTGKVKRLLVAPNLKLDCSAGPLPEIKVTTAPKNGSIITKTGKLKTPPRFRCPNKDAEAQAVFYQSQPNYAGSDAVVIEMKTPDGTVQTYDIRITVEAGKKEQPKDKDATDL